MPWLAISTVSHAASLSVRSGFASTHRELRKAVKGTESPMSMSTSAVSAPDPPGPPQASNVRHTPAARVSEAIPSPTRSNQAGARPVNSAMISSREGVPGSGEGEVAIAPGSPVPGARLGEAVSATGDERGGADPGAPPHAPSAVNPVTARRPCTTARRLGSDDETGIRGFCHSCRRAHPRPLPVGWAALGSAFATG